MARVERVLVVNAGSETLKLSVVGADGASEAVEGFVPADAVGHRVVHGGDRFREPVVVDGEVLEAIESLVPLAPLHNAPALRGLQEARAALPEVPHVAAFDTAFHATIPEEAATYAVPPAWRVRRYGFHGIAVQWAAEQVPVPRLVVCHLGGGSSVTAVREGRSVDTTMGFTPLEGVPMQTRSGSVDPGALLYVQRERGLTADDLEDALNRASGVGALGGLDSPLGFAVYTYRVAQAVAAMATALGGLDALAFSGGIGENRADVRAAICDRLPFLGLDGKRVHVVAAREELVIAREVRRVLAS